jgi:hypothetical protein
MQIKEQTMSLNMKEIERKAYTTLNEDGIVDIAIGCTFLGWGILLAVELPGLISLLAPLAFAIWYFGKRFLTIPRIGLIVPSKKMEHKIRNLSIFLFALGLIILAGILLWQWGNDSPLADHSLGILGLVIAGGISIIAFLIKANRLYVYALFLFIAFAAGENLNRSITTVDTFILSVILAAALIGLSGLIVLIRFLRKYPLPVKEV